MAIGPGGDAICKSKTIHAVTSGGKYGNAYSITVSQNTVSLQSGKTSKINAKAYSSQKMKKHRKLAYESSNPMIASVSKSGVIKGVTSGTCYVYVYAQNGLSAKVKVTVK